MHMKRLLLTFVCLAFSLPVFSKSDCKKKIVAVLAQPQLASPMSSTDSLRLAEMIRVRADNVLGSPSVEKKANLFWIEKYNLYRSVYRNERNEKVELVFPKEGLVFGYVVHLRRGSKYNCTSSNFFATSLGKDKANEIE